ncbi:hypothetical protein KI809_17935 [Geobacter pelophilus]|uniref:Uncharacterized protein n=1 Tax=Geoanaerobacter pelophilus TaxID=60036 RepID=A0AAW4L5B9_9BACT|nr:hypothetical protein [Geoanaerobacter pelophilus]MBT0666196.1 hypothetical protein [Geoanaerobacter pelophilus]
MKNKALNKGKTACAVVAAVAGLLAGVAGEASASVSSINYGINSTTAPSRIWSEGGTGPIKGTSINIVDVMGLNTSRNQGSHPIVSGTLDFTSGLYQNSASKIDTYGDNGTFKILGNFDVNGDGTVETNATLLSGTINSLSLDRSNSSRYSISNAKLTVTENALASYFGYGAGTKFTGLMNLNFSVLPSAFDGGATNNGNISTSPVPLPAAISLFVPAVAGLFGLRRRQIAC